MPMSPPIDELFTIAPLPCLRICSSSYFMQFQTPFRFTAVMRSNSPPLASAVSTAGDITPALLKAASRRPKVDTVCSIIAFTSASFVTSQRTPIALWPASTICLAAARDSASLTSASTTAAPSAANACAVVKPMPDAAPVTSATLFSNDRFIFIYIPFLSSGPGDAAVAERDGIGAKDPDADYRKEQCGSFLAD